MIVCLGWGSLIWDPRDLPLSGDWNDDGPELPLEFARQSSDGRLTLVIAPGVPLQRVLWAPLSATTSAASIEALRIREGAETERPIGRWPNAQPQHVCVKLIEHWTRSRGLDGVVWTALGPKFYGRAGQSPTEAEAIEYLGGLSGRNRERAEEYVRKAPPQIDTSYRRAIAEALGWTPISVTAAH